MRDRSYLFHEGDLSATLDAHSRKVQEVVDSISRDQLLASPVDDVVSYVVGEVQIDPIALYEDRMVRDQQEIKIDVTGWPGRYTRGDGPCLVAGIRVIISVPFTGDSTLWRLRPSSFTSILPFGEVRANQLAMVFELPADQSVEQIKKELDDNLTGIRRYLNWQQESIDSFNNSLPRLSRTVVEARKTRLGKHDQLAALLKIPLRHDPNAPEMRSIPVQRRLVKPLPPPPIGGFKEEWAIDEQEYENLLTILRHEGRTFEATPRTYAIHPEEELRDILLAHLNGHYKGDATGETFRRVGKTDIRIEWDSRTAFVAECKVWSGAQTIGGSIDQLLSYLTWRDCKAAIVVFDKDVAGFSELLSKALTETESHPRFVKLTKPSNEGEWRGVFRSNDDDARLVHVHFFIFNLFVPKKTKRPRKS
jgi:hypothetical protein